MILILYHVRSPEAFGEPFTDSTDGKKKDLDRVVVLSSNEITEEAKDSLWASLKGARLDKLVKFVDGNQLIKLLEDHLPLCLLGMNMIISKDTSMQ